MKNNILLFIVVVVLLQSSESLYPQSIIPETAKLETLAVGLKQPEGPVWVDGLGLLFSDIMNNKIYLWSPETRQLSTYLSPSDSSNGLTLDRQGRLVLTQMAKRRIARRETDGTIVPLAEKFLGKKFNSPNDIVVKSDGSIFFTDPDFNVPAGQSKELPYKGIYRLNTNGTLYLLDSTFDKPNGICFSPDETKLYVNESQQRKIYVWDVVNDTAIANKRLLYTIQTNGYADGMKVDSAGNIYCTGPTGVWVISPQGSLLGKISTPLNPSNCAWGDADRKTLYITAGYGQGMLYRIRLATTGIGEQLHLQPQSINVSQNYPNPFNPSTTIYYTIPRQGTVSIKVYDSIGRAVATLVNAQQTAGNYEVVLDGTMLASGIYFYQLQLATSGSVVCSATKKCLLLK